MLHRETLEAYRNMSLEEKYALTLKMTSEATPFLFVGTEEQVERKFELLRRQNDERTRRMLEGMARARDAE